MEISDEELWATAVTTYGIGDIATTASGLNVMNVGEAHPVSQMVLDSYGIPGMVAVKAITLLAFYKGYQLTPERYRSGIPLGLTIIGAGIMASNSMTIAEGIKEIQ